MSMLNFRLRAENRHPVLLVILDILHFVLPKLGLKQSVVGVIYFKAGIPDVAGTQRREFFATCATPRVAQATFLFTQWECAQKWSKHFQRRNSLCHLATVNTIHRAVVVPVVAEVRLLNLPGYQKKHICNIRNKLYVPDLKEQE